MRIPTFFVETFVTPPPDAFIRRGKLVRVIDGDTIVIDVDRGFATWNQQTIRLFGINAPESRGYQSPAGRWVTERVREWIGDCHEVLIHSREYSVDKYQRCVAEVWIGGHSLNQWLLAKGYGWPTDETGRSIGPQNVDALSIPDGIKQSVREHQA